MRGTVRAALTRGDRGWRREVRLDLPAGESLVISSRRDAARERVASTVSGAAIPIHGPWTLKLRGRRPDAARRADHRATTSWTALGGDAVKAFSGTATYAARFPRPRGRADVWRLDLGRVHDSARVRLNGQDLETLIGPHFRLTVTPDRLRASNLLEVTVTNLMANRVAALERSGVPWKKFYNVNFPSRLPENRGAGRPLQRGEVGAARLGPARPGGDHAATNHATLVVWRSRTIKSSDHRVEAMLSSHRTTMPT